MYSLLVVDDEKYAVWGVSRGIDWNELGIYQVFEAFDTESALEILAHNQVDVVISDIEMPRRTGLDLLKWIRQNRPEIMVIFLTAHADFAYAREALELGSFNYALKPVDHQVLRDMVAVALKSAVQKKENTKTEQLYAAHLDAWRSHIPVAVENFWCGLLDGRRKMTPELIDRTLKLYGIPLGAASKVRPVLVSVENFSEPLNGREEEILTHAVSEYLAGALFPEKEGTLIPYDEELLLLVYQEMEEEALEQRCRELSQRCKELYLCSVAFYFGRPVHLEELRGEYQSLVRKEQANTQHNVPVYPADFTVEPADHAADLPVIFDWMPQLDWGKRDVFLEKLKKLFAFMRQNHITDRRSLEEIYAGLNYLFLSASRRNNVALAVEPQTMSDVLKSADRMEEWAVKLSEDYFSALSKSQKGKSEIIQKVERYVEEHIAEDFGRDDIARALFFNSAYLSRMFKAETGVSLNEFVGRIRMREAKRLLDTTNYSISLAASKTGYSNFSYFTKQFKEAYGVTPSEYKKRLSNG